MLKTLTLCTVTLSHSQLFTASWLASLPERDTRALPLPHLHARSPKMSLTLYTSPGTRAQIIEWFAAELGAPLKLVPAGDRASAAFLAVHPFGKLPAALSTDGEPIFESGAILLYLADAFGGATTPSSRAAGAKWVLWANASLWPAVETRRAVPPPMLEGLEAILSKQPFLTGAKFGVADVAVGAYLHYTAAFFSVCYSGAVARYVAAIVAREHFRATIGAE